MQFDSATCSSSSSEQLQGVEFSAQASGGTCFGQRLHLNQISMLVSGKELLVDATLRLELGETYGLVGQNGCGKTTLLRGMAQGVIPGWPAACRVVLVEQEDIVDDRPALEVSLSSLNAIALLRRKEHILAAATSPETAKCALCEVELLDAKEALRIAETRDHVPSSEFVRVQAVLESAQAAFQEATSGVGQHLHVGEDVQLTLDKHEMRAAEVLTQIRSSLQFVDSDAQEAKARVILHGLGFSNKTMLVPLRQLSGGWRMRAAIARALVAKPDILLLDEPTNHLDWPALLWLERYIKTLSSTILLVVSHDRAFLDAVATQIVRISNRSLYFYSGSYSDFEAALSSQIIEQEKYAARRQEKVEQAQEKVKQLEDEGQKRVVKLMRKYHAKTFESNTKGGRHKLNRNPHRQDACELLDVVASRRKKLGVGTSFDCRVGAERRTCGGTGGRFKLSAGDVIDDGTVFAHEDDDVSMNIESGGSLGYSGPLLQCQSLRFGYHQPFSQEFDLDVTLSSRIAILGVNGSGKSTLLRTLAQGLNPLHGSVHVHPRLSVAYFSQHVAETLSLDKTPVEALHDYSPDATNSQIRAQLGSFGLGKKATVKLMHLSGGEKTRCALAAITLRSPHMLLLDEPTNHLDLKAIEALTKALRAFKGGIVLVSHDRRLIQALEMECYMLQNRCLQRCTLDSFLQSAEIHPSVESDSGANFIEDSKSTVLAARLREILSKTKSHTICRCLQQIESLNISRDEDLTVLADEIVGKASTRHSVIPACAELCATVHEWCMRKQIGSCPEKSFKRILLTKCQTFMERRMQGVKDENLPESDLEIAVIGIARLLGNLILKGLVASQVLIVVSQQLLEESSSPLAVESLSALLTIAAPSVDSPVWKHFQALDTIFAELQRLPCSDGWDSSVIPHRIHCMVVELLELRMRKWKSY